MNGANWSEVDEYAKGEGRKRTIPKETHDVDLVFEFLG